MLTLECGSLGARLLAAGVLVGAGAATSAHGAVLVYQANLDGPSEAPPSGSPATGSATVTVDTAASTMRVEVSFAGLLGTVSACHIHGATALAGEGTAGVMTTTPTFAGFPLGVTSGAYDHTLNMLADSSYNPAYITAHGGSAATAMPDLFQAIADGKAYLNLHSSVFPGGEIRGFLTPAPGGAALFALGALAAIRRRRA